MTRIENHYRNVIARDALRNFHYDNAHELPKMDKIVINASLVHMDFSKLYIPTLLVGLEAISGQFPTLSFSSKGNVRLKVRKGMVVGAKVTLRRDGMYAFMERFIQMIMPRIKYFEGVPFKNMNQEGNLSISLTDMNVFPELESQFEKFRMFQEVDITFVTRCRNKEEAKYLLSSFQFPFQQ